MKTILKTIGFGIVLGTAIFFVPFLFKFILIAMLAGMVFRMFIRNKRKHFINRLKQFENDYSPIVPIDNQWHVATVQINSPAQNINVNY